MKLQCEVMAVETIGESLRVRLQGKARSDASWRPLEPQTITIANSEAAARAFYVGRKVELTIKAKP